MNGEPTIDETRALRRQLSDACWAKRVCEAEARVAVVQELLTICPGKKKPGRADVQRLSSPEDRTNAMRWWVLYHRRAGEPWERLLDRRAPQRPWETPETWRLVVQALGRQEPPPTWEQIRGALVKQFGPEANLGKTVIRSILAEVGLKPGSSRPRAPVEEVTELNGGGALVLVAAALEETGALRSMAQKIQLLVGSLESPEQVESEPAGRDELGRLTAEYNRNVVARLRAAVPARTVFRSVEDAVQGKDLTELRVSQLSAVTLEQHLRCLVCLPLVTMRRGVVGLDDPAGGWLEVVSEVAYQAATMEKTLTGLKYLGVGGMMWESHARVWLSWSRKWSGAEPWRQIATYVDATKDPWWTEHFAKSGKVSRTGRVQPCLERTVLTAGPGVPLFCQVLPGTGDLGEAVFSMLGLCDVVLGRGAVGRLTIVDAECCELEMMRRFTADPERDIITVLKGPLAKGKKPEPVGEWQPYRQRDQLREVIVNLEPGKADGLKVRGVEMTRPDSRRPRSYCFLTTAKQEALPTLGVADGYLSRWPAQEDVFKRGRNGLGLERSSGFGASAVTNLALLEKRAEATRKLHRVNRRVEQALAGEVDATRALAVAQQRTADAVAGQDGHPDDGSFASRLATEHLAERQRATKLARKKQEVATEELRELESTPAEIFVRDTALDTISSCLKMVLLCLLEFVCREYLGGRRLTPRTFIDSWMPLPVTIRKSKHRLVYEVAPNPRDRAMTDLLRSALAQVSARQLKVDGRLLVASLRGEEGTRRDSS